MIVSSINRLETKTLREQVYERLREALQDGDIHPGAALPLDDLSRALGISRTPLREALLQLENEGFVEILPRRGCVVRRLDQREIRELYQLIGAMEASVIREMGAELTDQDLTTMRELNEQMRVALDQDDFDRFHAANLALHEVYLSRSPNQRLRRLVGIWKQRLYDFPRRPGFVKEWELASCDEHARLIELLAGEDLDAAADFLQQIHWSFEVQRPFIERYYAEEALPSVETGGEQ